MAIKEKVLVPAVTENDENVLLIDFLAEDRGTVEAGDMICAIETSKTVVEITCNESGFIEWLFNKGEVIKIGECLALIHDEVPTTSSKTKENNVEVDNTTATETIFSKKALQQLELSKELSENDFKDQYFVTAEDVEAKLADSASGTGNDAYGTPVSFQKQQEIRALSGGQNTLTSNFSVKVCLSDTFVEKSGPTSFNNMINNLTPTILSGTSELLKKHKELNAYFKNNRIHYYNHVALGYALDMGKGLKVVNLGDLSEKSPKEINRVMFDYFFYRYSKDKLTINDLTGSTFSITDVSGEKVLEFSPLINANQSAILGISSIDEQEKFFILNLVFDHRVTEGKKAAAFLNDLKDYVEQLLEGDSNPSNG